LFAIIGVDEGLCPDKTGIATPEGLVPLAPMPREPASEVAVLPVKGWARRKSPRCNELE
jgi:hypothetical protein